MSTIQLFFIPIIVMFLQLITPHSLTNLKIQNPCQPPHHDSYPFCNTSLSTKSRARYLLSLLTLDEKIQQLSNNASAVPRLGIPPYEWWSESLHGIAVNGPGVSFDGAIKSATGFPQVILTAASFNRSLWSAVASAIAVEAKAMFNVGQAGLTYWAPNINIFRDPRWGRGQETPGEDPMVTSAFAVEYVRAFQGQYYGAAEGTEKFRFGHRRKELREEEDDGGKLMLSACCKHFTAYDLEKWGQFTRYNFNAVDANPIHNCWQAFQANTSKFEFELNGLEAVSADLKHVTDQDMADTYQPPFKSCIQQGRASCLMCSYNAVNGIPACADSGLLHKVRTEWNFQGYITSDCDAVATIYEDQKYTKTPEDAVAIALKSGTDINCGTYMSRHMKSVIRKGMVLEKDIDRALLNLFSVQLRLGLFDGKHERNGFRGFGPQDVCSSEHKKLALEAAMQGIVLLKNGHKILPLDKHSISSLAVLGPLANSTKLGGDYTGIPCKPKSILGGLQDYVNIVYHAMGCIDVSCNSTDNFSEALSVAKQAEYVVVVAGLDLSQEEEDHDRYSLLLPGYQMKLVNAVASVSKRPLILVLTGGGPLDVSFAVEDPRVGSILWIGYPGETGGTALSEIILGHYSPGGRLPMTWYPESFTRVPMSDMNMRADASRNYPGRTYRFYNGDRVYPFGYGLSYTSFTYKLLSAPSKLSLQGFVQDRQKKNMLYQTRKGLDYVYIDELPYCDSLRFKVQISVTNKGDMDGSEVVLLFAKGLKLFEGSPERQLIGFDRVSLLRNSTAETSFVVDPCEHLSFADEHGNKILPTGDHIIVSQDLEHKVSIELS